MVKYVGTFLRNKSIQFQMFFSFLLFIITLSIFFLSMYFSKTEQAKVLEEYTTNIEILSDLSFGISRTKSEIHNFYKRDERNYFNEFIKSRAEVERTIEDLQGILKGTEYYIFIRIIDNLNDYITNELSDYSMEISFDVDYYNHQQRVLHAFSLMGVYSDECLSTYIKNAKIKLSNTLKAHDHNQDILGIVLSICLILAFFISASVLNQIGNDLKKMSRHAELLTHATWNIEDLHIDSVSELNTLAIGINTMKQSLNEYFIKLKENAEIEIKYQQQKRLISEKSQLLYKARYEQLAKKLDPHFLFNALNIIYRECMFAQQKEIMQTVSALAEVLRYHIEIGSDFVTLAQELSVLDSYIFIHKKRFDDKMQVEKRIDCPRDTMIIPFILQPIIEVLLSDKTWSKDATGSIFVAITQAPDNNISIMITLSSMQGFWKNCNPSYATNITPNDFENLKVRMAHFYQRDIHFNERCTEDTHRVELLIPSRSHEDEEYAYV